MSEIRAGFAERAIQSFKHIIYRYIEDNGEKFVPKLQQFLSTLNCLKNRQSYMLKDLLHQYMHCSIVNHFNQKNSSENS